MYKKSTKPIIGILLVAVMTLMCLQITAGR